MLVEKQGDLFDHLPKKCIIPHVVNNRGAFLSGFVVPLAKNFPKCKQDYEKVCKNLSREDQDKLLGEVWYSHGDIMIAHMFAQTLEGIRPLRYDKLVHCMEHVGITAKSKKLPIFTCRFGSLRSGGNWEFIKELIQDIWGDLDVTVYYFDVPR